MRTKSLVLFFAVALAVAACSFLAFQNLPKDGRIAASVCASAFLIYVFYRSIWIPERLRKFWIRLANEHSFDYRKGPYNEPRLTRADGLKLSLTRHLSPARRNQVLISFPLTATIPETLKIHRRDQLGWLHEFTGANAVAVAGAPTIWNIECADEVAARVLTEKLIEPLQALEAKYEGFILFGAGLDPDGVGAVSLIFAHTFDAQKILKACELVCDCERQILNALVEPP